MSHLKKPIDYKILENELEDAVRADELYKLQNDAKFRAIEQRVPTYDHFRNMVQAAHLRPLERAEMQKKTEVSWNHCLRRDGEVVLDLHDHQSLNLIAAKSCEDIEPQTSAEFLKIWRNLSDFRQKFEYLLRYRDSLKDRFFRVEVPPEFLEEFFESSLEICSAETAPSIVDALRTLSECGRFSLSLAMTSDGEKSPLRLLFGKLLSSVQESAEIDEVERLAKSYWVSLRKISNNNNEIK